MHLIARMCVGLLYDEIIIFFFRKKSSIMQWKLNKNLFIVHPQNQNTAHTYTRARARVTIRLMLTLMLFCWMMESIQRGRNA